MKKEIVYFNGRFIPLKKAVIPTLDSAYLYGEGLFETIRGEGKRLMFAGEHYDRMVRNCKPLNLEMPVSKPRFLKILRAGLKKTRFKKTYIRVNLSKSEKVIGKRKRIFGRKNLHIVFAPENSYPKKLFTNGAEIIVVRSVVNDPLPLSHIKSVSYLSKMLGRIEVKKRKAVEGILLNSKGYVTEVTSSNIFIIKNGVIKTPPLSDGLLPGVTRKAIIKLAGKNRIPLRETHIKLKSVYNADEVFITSSLKDVMPIRRLEKKKIGKPCPGPITQILMRKFRETYL